MVESGYVCNLADFALEHYYEEPADFDNSADSPKQICISELSECKFSYSDGQTWKTTWEEKTGQVPRMIKIDFKFKNETKEREFVVNIPISP